MCIRDRYDGVLQLGLSFKLEGGEARHILKSRRIRYGERFHIQDREGLRFEAKLTKYNHNSLVFVTENKVFIPKESDLCLEVLQALPKVKAPQTNVTPLDC